MLAPMPELREFTGRTQPSAVARRLREVLGIDTITVNAAGCVTLPNDAWQRVKRGEYVRPNALATPARTAQTYALRIPTHRQQRAA